MKMGWVPYDVDSPVGSSILLENGEQWMFDERIPLRYEVALLREALESIAKNTCCDGCQEAAIVARDALRKAKGGE